MCPSDYQPANPAKLGERSAPEGHNAAPGFSPLGLEADTSTVWVHQGSAALTKYLSAWGTEPGEDQHSTSLVTEQPGSTAAAPPLSLKARSCWQCCCRWLSTSGKRSSSSSGLKGKDSWGQGESFGLCQAAQTGRMQHIRSQLTFTDERHGCPDASVDLGAPRISDKL